MKKYLLFGFDNYYPGGGMNDLVAKFDTIDELEKELKEHYTCDEYQLLSIDNGFTQIDIILDDLIDVYTMNRQEKKRVLKEWIESKLQ